jgi:hypothetical protein
VTSWAAFSTSTNKPPDLNGCGLGTYNASCYRHDVHEAWIDAILGSWGDNQFDDHVTFGCRVGPVMD